MNDRFQGSRSMEVYAFALAFFSSVLFAYCLARDGSLAYRFGFACLTLLLSGSALVVGGKWFSLAAAGLNVFVILAGAFDIIRLSWYDIIIMVALGAICAYISYGTRQHILAVRSAYAHEHARYIESVMIDPVTELKTRRAYQSDASIYLRLARRNNLQVALFAWKFKDESKIKSAVGEDGFLELMRKITVVLRGKIRYEDISFMLDSNPYMWGALMITQDAYLRVIADRQLNALKEIRMDGLFENWTDEILVGAGLYDGENDLSPLTLYDRALSSLNSGEFPKPA